MATKNSRSYSLVLHGLLLVMAFLLVGLARENRALKQILAPAEPLVAGVEALPIPVQDLAGRDDTLAFTDASRETLLMIFTTTCPACRENQAGWRAIYEANQDRYRIVGVSLEDAATTLAYRDAEDLPYPIVLPSEVDRFTVEYGVTRIPTTVHVDRDGKVRDAWVGVLPEDVLARFQPVALAALEPR